MATQPRHLHRLLAFFDPLFGCPALVVESHHRPTRQTQARNDKAHPREQLALVMFHFGHHAAGLLPARCLVEKTLVLHQRLDAGPSHRSRQQLRDVPLQAVVGRDADRVRDAPLLQRLVDLRFGKSGVGPKGYLVTQLLLPLDLGQQQFLPIVGAVHIAGRSLAARQSPSRLNNNSG